MCRETTVHIENNKVEVEDNYGIHINRQSYPRRRINLQLLSQLDLSGSTLYPLMGAVNSFPEGEVPE